MPPPTAPTVRLPNEPALDLCPPRPSRTFPLRPFSASPASSRPRSGRGGERAALSVLQIQSSSPCCGQIFTAPPAILAPRPSGSGWRPGSRGPASHHRSCDATKPYVVLMYIRLSPAHLQLALTVFRDGPFQTDLDSARPHPTTSHLRCHTYATNSRTSFGRPVAASTPAPSSPCCRQDIEGDMVVGSGGRGMTNAPKEANGRIARDAPLPPYRSDRHGIWVHFQAHSMEIIRSDECHDTVKSRGGPAT
ncbi:uncharacterized protein K452DRAFT_83606 [Aplosporella prunicola CBS 121167]|uniref:Uncharacterized protein n=1 Tax=Aplosporella prunicola CBS 121167 TaxID=1176127 RepID=A0A6A6B624_9PEZI|nr:uncharacterized protein K452DRAFT_83606 [Aplosporella prunicola CBS 121167]KAF2138725.1 hypothetical protein K452DRAFT_83606 [Aplosporella prunicola CBS 121167]